MEKKIFQTCDRLSGHARGRWPLGPGQRYLVLRDCDCDYGRVLAGRTVRERNVRQASELEMFGKHEPAAAWPRCNGDTLENLLSGLAVGGHACVSDVGGVMDASPECPPMAFRVVKGSIAL